MSWILNHHYYDVDLNQEYIINLHHVGVNININMVKIIYM